MLCVSRPRPETRTQSHCLGVRIGYIGLGMVCSKKLSIEAVAANEASATYPVEAEEHTESHCDVPTSDELEDVAFL